MELGDRQAEEVAGCCARAPVPPPVTLDAPIRVSGNGSPAPAVVPLPKLVRFLV